MFRFGAWGVQVWGSQLHIRVWILGFEASVFGRLSCVVFEGRLDTVQGLGFVYQKLRFGVLGSSPKP